MYCEERKVWNMEHKRLLITGFEPFGGETVNPSWEAVRRLPERIICKERAGAATQGEIVDAESICVEYILTKLQIPVVYGRAAEMVLDTAKELCPDVILSVGQAKGRDKVTPEVIGINLREGTIPDNEGYQPEGVPVVQDGPAAYFSTVPVRGMVAAMKAEGLPGALSYSAGVYVCNDVLYSLLRYYHGTGTLVGFVHVPLLPEQAKEGEPCMSLEEIVRALEVAIGVTVLPPGQSLR